MEFSEFRPVLSGLVGGLIAIWLSAALSRWVPKVCNEKNADALAMEYRHAIWCANGLLVCGWIVGMCLYASQVIRKDDWRGLGLGIGGGSLAALISLALFGLLQRAPLKEVFVAYAVSQKAPMFLIYGILSCCVTFFFVAVSSVLS